MKICVCGSRTITNYKIIEQGINNILRENNFLATELISGCATGPDKLGETWAAKNGVNIVRMPADWKKYGLSAGYIRNCQMADISDIIISFWDGKSRGSKHMIDYCKKISKKIFIFDEEGKAHVNVSN